MSKLAQMLNILQELDEAINGLEKWRFDLTRQIHKHILENTDIPVVFADKYGNILGELDRKTSKIVGGN